MLLKDPKKNEKLQELISEADTATDIFDKWQEKAVTLNTNMERNKKMIEALKAENLELKAQSDKVSVSEMGEVDFSQFDNFQDQIAMNKRKIKALEEVIEDFELHFEYLQTGDYIRSYDTAQGRIKDVLEFLAEGLLAELLTDKEALKRINVIRSLFYRTGHRNPMNVILEAVRNNLDYSFRADISFVKLPESKLYYHKLENIGYRLYQRHEQLKQIIEDRKKAKEQINSDG